MQNTCKHLLQKKLIACANFFPVESMYWWQGEIEESNEVVALLKAKNDNWDKIQSEVEKLHPYEVPCVIKFSVEINKGYGEWVDSLTLCVNSC